jgi:hypothetical protein
LSQQHIYTSTVKTYDEKHAAAYRATVEPHPYEEEGIITSGTTRHVTGERDVFGNEEHHQIKYKTLSWQLVAVLMIAEITEIASNGMLSLPTSGGGGVY